MVIFNWKIILACCLFFLACTILIKFFIDICLPDYEQSAMFTFAPSSPRLVCSAIVSWNDYARARHTDVYSDFLRLPILLGRFPKEPRALVSVFSLIFFFSLISSWVWQWTIYIRREALPKLGKPKPILTRTKATHAILPHYRSDRQESGDDS